MREKLIALSIGLAMLGGAGMAQADPMAPTKAQTEKATSVRSQAASPMVLTDDQMKKVSAGHFRNQRAPSNIFQGPTWHWGWFEYFSGGTWRSLYGYHRG